MRRFRERENQIAAEVVDCCIEIHRTLGPGLFESVYERILKHELEKRGLTVGRQVSIPVVWDGLQIDDAFRADLLVEGRVLLELKSLDVVPKIAFKQVTTYLKVADLRLGLLLNFGGELMKPGIRRIANGLPDELA